MQDTSGTQNRGTGNGAQTGPTQIDEALIRRMFAIFNEHDLTKMLTFVSPDCTVMNVAQNKTYQGHSGFREYMQNWMTAFPDYKLDVTNVVCANDRCLVEFTARATHKGNLLVPSGNVQPSNKRVELRFADAQEFRGGLLTKIRSYYDGVSLMTQLGIMPKI